ncbi:hypothetical protein [Flavobacterium sp. WC2430]|uniref:hypothetical protein n=1 Tax=Flavobacterium sp. WC2430 TaxID=3234137 RepID=UPI0034679462
MPCPHKFLDDLNLDQLNFEPETLIVGTFNPAWPANNQAEWFYGRTHDQHGNVNNNFWDVLPRLYGENSLINATPVEWKAFCKRHKIAITDLIENIADADEAIGEHVIGLASYSDRSIAEDFDEQVPNNIVALLQNHPTITNVYLTRGTGETFWRRLWRPVVQYSNQNGLHEKKLLTPSGYAFYQHGAHNNQNPNNQIALLNDFILMKWHNEWHF